jgi:hypothetical protein
MQMANFALATTGTDMQEEPLVHTTKGNVPLSKLQYRHFWEEDDVATTFIEEYWLEGELVRRNAHSRLKRGLDAAIQNQLFGMNQNG